LRLRDSTHTARPWLIHDVARGFRLEDVWALPTPGGPDDFPRLVELITAGAPEGGSSRAARALWAIRWKLGELLGWDDETVARPSIRSRVPPDLRGGPAFATLPFKPLYLLDDEFAAEIANATVHGILHVGWVQDGAGGYRGELAVYVKPNGRLGNVYMAAIKPFRHRLVYPQLLRDLERRWRLS
jgi:hypothetical protein